MQGRPSSARYAPNGGEASSGSINSAGLAATIPARGKMQDKCENDRLLLRARAHGARELVTAPPEYRGEAELPRARCIFIRRASPGLSDELDLPSSLSRTGLARSSVLLLGGVERAAGDVVWSEGLTLCWGVFRGLAVRNLFGFFIADLLVGTLLVLLAWYGGL